MIKIALKNPLQVSIGLITRSMTTKLKMYSMGLNQNICANMDFKEATSTSEDKILVNLINAQYGPNPSTLWAN
jgi:hypothetical protein